MNKIEELKGLLEEQQCSYCVGSDSAEVPCDQELAVVCTNDCAASCTL